MYKTLKITEPFTISGDLNGQLLGALFVQLVDGARNMHNVCFGHGNMVSAYLLNLSVVKTNNL